MDDEAVGHYKFCADMGGADAQMLQRLSGETLWAYQRHGGGETELIERLIPSADPHELQPLGNCARDVRPQWRVSPVAMVDAATCGLDGWGSHTRDAPSASVPSHGARASVQRMPMRGLERGLRFSVRLVFNIWAMRFPFLRAQSSESWSHHRISSPWCWKPGGDVTTVGRVSCHRAFTARVSGC